MKAATWSLRTFGTTVAVTALLACGKSNSPPGPGAAAPSNGVPSVQINLKFAHASYTVGEDIGMTVTVTNETAAEIEVPDPFHRDNWQPSYTLTGPAYPAGHRFSFRSVALEDTLPEPEGVDPVLVKLEPGQVLVQEVPLRSWVPLGAAGDYEIVAQLAWKNVAAKSPLARFRLEKSQVNSASVGVDVEAAGTPGEWVEWFHRESTGQRLYTALFKRPHTDVHGYEGFAVTPIFSAAASATDLLLPWTNYNRQAELTKWRAWREGTALLALATAFPAPQRLELGAAPRTLVRPALMAQSGELDIFFITAGAPELALARFPAPKWEGAQTPASVLWKTPLPGESVALRSAIAPYNLGSQRQVLAVTQEAGAVAVHLMNAGDGSRAGVWQSTRIANATLLPGTMPALRVDREGVSHAALLLQLPDKDKRLFAVADLAFGHDGKPVGNATVKPLGALDATPLAATAAYVVMPGTGMRRDWAVLLNNGRLLHSSHDGTISHVLQAAPVLPLQLLPLGAGTYLLTLDGNGKPGFTLLD